MPEGVFVMPGGDLMAKPEPVTLARVIITRVLNHKGDIVDHVLAESDDGYELGLAEALGMMRLAEDTLIRARLND